MGKASNKRPKPDGIFSQLEADLAAVDPSLSGSILCPMCMARFTRAQIGELTREHIVPRTLGGRSLTLTCKPCNNAFGEQVQSHLTTLMKVNDSYRGESELRGRLRMGGDEVIAGMRVKPGEGIDFVHRGGRPGTIERMGAAMQQGTVNFTMEVNLGYKPARASVAIYRTAYLAAFATFGYKYILSPAVDVVREAIRRGMSEHMPELNVLTGLLKGASEVTGELPEFAVLPLEGYGTPPPIYVGIRLAGAVPYWTFAILPGATQEAASLFTDLKVTMDALSTSRLKMSGQGRAITRWEVVPG